MIPLLIILYFFSKNFIIFYFILNYFLAILIYFKASACYFPHMKFKEDELKRHEENKANDGPKKQYFHEDYPSFNRVELTSITFGWIYWGVLNYFWYKTVAAIFSLFLAWVRTKIYFIGRNVKADLTKKDKLNISKFIRTFMTLLYSSMGVRVIEKDISRNEQVLKIYRKYLGEDYNPENYADKFTTVIANHISWADILYILSRESSSFIAKASVIQIPMVGFISYALKTLFIDRASKDSRSEIFNMIGERQKAVQAGTSSFPVCIYPEGTTSTGRSLITFKKGAFYTLTPIKIYLLKVDHSPGSFPLAAGGMNILLHIALSYTFWRCNMNAFFLPVVAATDYLFENYKHLGKDKPEIYSEACRHIMSEIGGFPLSNSNYDTKLQYMSEIKRKIVKNT